MKKSTFLAVSLGTSLLLGIAMAQSGGKPVVGLITKTETNPFFVKMKEGAQNAATAGGAQLMTGAGTSDGDNDSQVAVLKKMVAAGAKTILITPSDPQAIVPALRDARSKGVQIIALDSITDPKSAVDAIFATNNLRAGYLIGQYAKSAIGKKKPVIAMLDLAPGLAVGVSRHNGFLLGFGMEDDNDARIVCIRDTSGDQKLGQTAMEQCLSKNPDINIVYTINEPAAAGAYQALVKAGKQNQAMIVSIDGGCQGVRDIKKGNFAATAQQYPLRMASLGVEAGLIYSKTGKKANGYTDTGVNLITDKPMAGVKSKDSNFGTENCWGN
ncbi:substrate-binding domain-containing protein [Deinococcus sp.]|uniref:substrate-binding domain-containing protein n=1 Tax=Deinococcus sp. TaxID=47478 RepID=UPI003B5AEF2F